MKKLLRERHIKLKAAVIKNKMTKQVARPLTKEDKDKLAERLKKKEEEEEKRQFEHQERMHKLAESQMKAKAKREHIEAMFLKSRNDL